MRSVNKVILIGNLTRDPEVRQTPNGQSVTTFGIATNREWITKDGKAHTSSEFHELVAWSRLAEICGKYLKKGKLIYIEGYLKTRSWDTPEGIRKFKTEIVIQDMIMLEKRTSQGEQYIPEEENATTHAAATSASSATPAAADTRTAEPEIKSPARIRVKTEHTPAVAIGNITPAQKIDIDQDLGL